MTEVSTTTAAISQKTQILRITLGLTFFSLVTFLIILTSSHWMIIRYPSDFFSKRQNKFVGRSTYGIIRECAFSRFANKTVWEKKCDYHPNHAQNTSIPAEHTLLGMIRTMISFSIIHIFLAIITFICGLYSIRDHRYTYKRLTGMIYILTAASLVVCIEVLSTIFRHANEFLPDIYPPGTDYSFGACYIIAWMIFIQLLASAFVFFACSKKRKGIFDEATEEEARANQRVDLGRSF